jgi:hypothetical protein
VHVQSLSQPARQAIRSSPSQTSPAWFTSPSPQIGVGRAGPFTSVVSSPIDPSTRIIWRSSRSPSIETRVKWYPGSAWAV